MPGPFTHLYTQRLLADLLAKAAREGGVTGNQNNALFGGYAVVVLGE